MNDQMTMVAALDMYRSIYHRFEKLEGKPWGIEGGVIELSKQVGELSRLVMTEEGYYFPNRPGYESNTELIGDELADIFGAIIRIGDHYGVDLVSAHIKARAAEAASLDELGA